MEIIAGTLAISRVNDLVMLYRKVTPDFFEPTEDKERERGKRNDFIKWCNGTYNVVILHSVTRATSDSLLRPLLLCASPPASVSSSATFASRFSARSFPFGRAVGWNSITNIPLVRRNFRHVSALFVLHVAICVYPLSTRDYIRSRVIRMTSPRRYLRWKLTSQNFEFLKNLAGKPSK